MLEWGCVCVYMCGGEVPHSPTSLPSPSSPTHIHSPCALVVVSFKVKCRLSDSADTIISGPSHTHRTSGRTKSSKTVYTTCPPSLYTRPGRGQHSGARGYSQMRSCAAQGPFDPGLSRVRLQDRPENPVRRREECSSKKNAAER